MLKKYKLYGIGKLTSRQLDLLGEYLRDCFFDQDEDKLGCYSTFDIREDVIPLEKEPVKWDDDVNFYWEVFEKEVDEEKIKMRYYWDGDGALQFIFEDGSMIENTDCKCDYNWFYSDKVEG